MPRKVPPPSRSAHSSKNSRPKQDSKSAPSLASLRSDIDRIDRDIVALLNRSVVLMNQRAELASNIGRLKEKQGLEVWSPAREEEVLTKVVDASSGPLPQETLRLMFRELMSGSRALQTPLRIAFLGPKYSYSHLASV